MLDAKSGKQMLGQYELRELLGQGGMGSVYRAFQASLKREVAIKVLPAHLVASPGYTERFTREAETAASLEHAHIVPVYDYGTSKEATYIVMRLLNGGTLSERAQQHKLAGHETISLTEIADILKQIASALDYAHSRGVIHRDIKPGNIMFDNQGSAYLTDFGIARLIEASTKLTSTGATLGTPLYMSPEQWRGDAITPASDQYAVAVMIYQLVTGHTPFEADTPYALMNKHIHEPPTPPQAYRSDIPEAVTTVLNRALSKNPAQRFPTVTSFAQAFSAAVASNQEESTQFLLFKVTHTPPSMPLPVQTPAVSAALPPPNKPFYRSPMLWVAGIAVIVIAALAALLISQEQRAAALTDSLTQTAIAFVPTQEATSTPTSEPVTAVNTETPAAAPTLTPTQVETTALPTAAPTEIFTDTATNVPPTASPTEAFTDTATNVPPTASPTEAFTDTATNVPPTASPTVAFTDTATNVPPTETETPPPTLTFTATRVPPSPTDTLPPPSNAPRPTNTPVSPTINPLIAIQITYEYIQSATAKMWTPTPTNDTTAAFSPTLTAAFEEGLTQTATLWTHTPEPVTPTNTPTNTPTTLPAPVAAFEAHPTSGTVPLTVTFTNHSTGNIVSYYWQFGDNSSSTDANPTHTYGRIGTFNVLLIVTGPGGTSIAQTSIETSAPTATTIPAALTTITRNDDWTPIHQTFAGIDMVLVPAGCFNLGSSAIEVDAAYAQCEADLGVGNCQHVWFEKETPQTQICFNQPFWIAYSETTNAQYGSISAAFTDTSATMPRDSVSWFGAAEFCAARGMRLPTEAEWEYAARGPDNLIYPWGNTFISNNAAYENNVSSPEHVGSRPSGISWVGAVDMAGNLREWTSTIFTPYPYTPGDGRESLSDTVSDRVVRGGSWYVIPVSLRAADRVNVPPITVDWNIGFRCVRDFQSSDLAGIG